MIVKIVVGYGNIPEGIQYLYNDDLKIPCKECGSPMLDPKHLEAYNLGKEFGAWLRANVAGSFYDGVNYYLKENP